MTDEGEQNGWKQISDLQDMLASLRKMAKPFPSIDYWLQASLKETVRVIDGNPTRMSDLPGIIAACPTHSSLPQIATKLQALSAVASDLGLDQLAGKIETAKRQADYEAKVRGK